MSAARSSWTPTRSTVSAQNRWSFLSALDHLSATDLYGVTFERATAVTYQDRKHIIISGTASIDSRGEIVAPGDIFKQLDRALENIDALLSSGKAQRTDLLQADRLSAQSNGRRRNQRSDSRKAAERALRRRHRSRLSPRLVDRNRGARHQSPDHRRLAALLAVPGEHAACAKRAIKTIANALSGFFYHAMSDRNRLILLTGCSRGLGAALTKQFDAGGHTVVGCARSEASLAALRGALPARHRFSVVDVSDAAMVGDWANQIFREIGVPDLVINNAAVINDPAPLWEVAADEIDALLNVNVKGVLNVIRAFFPAMRQRGTGVVVNLSSGAGRMGLPGLAPYCATKWAVEGLTKSLAEELPDGMAAIPLSPGVVDTDMLHQIWGDRAHAEIEPDSWAAQAAPYILSLGPAQNGESLTMVRQ